MDDLKHIYLLAGGRQSCHEAQYSLIQTIFKDNGTTSPIIAYVSTASRDNDAFFERMANTLRVAGAERVDNALISSDKADLLKAKKTLHPAAIVFLSGGNVLEGIAVLKDKKVGFLQELYKQGKLFFGISAGSIMLAERCVRWGDSDDALTAELFQCLGFTLIICDTHGV